MRIAAAKKLHNISKKFSTTFYALMLGHAGETLPLGANMLQESAQQHLSRGFTPAPPEPLGNVPRKATTGQDMHVDANIHSWEYNKPACQTLIFLSVQISMQLWRRRNIKI